MLNMNRYVTDIIVYKSKKNHLNFDFNGRVLFSKILLD